MGTADARPLRMRYLVVVCAGGALSLFGCAHTQAIDTPVTPAAVAAYRAVRNGAQPMDVAEDVEFCTADDGVQVISKRWRSTDDWADKFRDRDLQEEVRDLIGRDPTLSGQPMSVRVDQGAAIIDGSVQRDAEAVAAARDALAVPGVVGVELRTTSQESPAQPRLAATLCE